MLALLWALGATTAAAAQGRRVTDTITGTVAGPEGRPLLGAIVQATSMTSWETRRQSTDARGQFIIFFYENAGRYDLIVRYAGMEPARLTVARQGGAGLAARVRMEWAKAASPVGNIPVPQRDSSRTAPPAPPAPRPWSVYTGVSNVYDSNIDHSQVGPESYGLLGVFGGQYRQRFSGTTVELQYDGVFRQYTNTDTWNRPGHSASASLSQRVARHWAVGADGEVQINGSAEDRVLRNEYSVQPELEYRFTRTTRLELYGEYLLKRYPTPQQNAVDPRVGLRLRQLLGTRGSFAVSGRYEYNRADSTRYRYIGWTGGADLASPLGPGGRITSSLRQCIRRCTSRLG